MDVADYVLIKCMHFCFVICENLDNIYLLQFIFSKLELGKVFGVVCVLTRLVTCDQ